MTPAPRLDSLTSLRGLLAVWVVLHHFADDLFRLVPPLEPLAVFLHLGGFAVPGFFMLSGFVLAHTYAGQPGLATRRGVIRFWFTRLARIYPVHFVTLIVVLIEVVAAQLLGRPPNDPTGYAVREFALNLVLAQTWVPDFVLSWNYPSWSISSEWFAYLVFPFAALLLPALTDWRKAIAATALTVAASVVVYSVPPFPFQELVYVIPTFAAGMCIYSLTHGRRIPAGRALQWLPELAVLAIVVGCTIDSPVVITIAEFILILSLVALADDCLPWWRMRIPVYLGEVSYSLYMTHALAQKVLHKLLPTDRYGDADFGPRAAVLAAYAVLIAVSCLASYFLVEKPCRKLARRFRNDQAVRTSSNTTFPST